MVMVFYKLTRREGREGGYLIQMTWESEKLVFVVLKFVALCSV